MFKCPICHDTFDDHNEFIDHKCKIPATPAVKTRNIIGGRSNIRFNVENLQAAVYNIKMSAEELEDTMLIDFQEELENLEKQMIAYLNSAYIWK